MLNATGELQVVLEAFQKRPLSAGVKRVILSSSNI